MTRSSFSRILPGAALVVGACVSAAHRTPEPTSGVALVQAMHDAYAGRWFRTLVFVQRTTLHRPDGSTAEQTWLEALQAPSRLRIDVGPRDSANGMLFTADSTYRVRGGQVVRAIAGGNPFLPFVSGVYTQPVSRTLEEIGREGFDTTRMYVGRWQDRPTYVVGASSAADTTAPQFWVDRERLVLVRMILRAPSGAAEDIRLNDYRRYGDSWVATDIDIRVDGRTVQREQYSDVRTDVPLDPALLDAARWTTATHWAK